MEAALPRAHYVDGEAFDIERDMLRREWTCLGRVDELGLGQLSRVVAVQFHGESILLTRDEGGLHALANVCRHRGSQLVAQQAATCSMQVIRCPYHSWTYALDGTLLHAPHAPEVDRRAFGLTTLSVQAWGGWVWVAENPPMPLLEQLGPIPGRIERYPLAELVLGTRLHYRVWANWKVIAENYNECYHCGPVHPELCRLVPSFAGGGFDLPWEDGVPHREGAWTFTLSGTTSREPFPGLDEHERTRHKGELIYPNLLLSLSAEHAAAFILTPLAVDLTDVSCELLFHPDEVAKDGFDPCDASDLWDLVNRQDWAVCESVQRGMSSRYFTGGWYAPMEDASLDIRRWLLDRLGEAQPGRNAPRDNT